MSRREKNQMKPSHYGEEKYQGLLKFFSMFMEMKQTSEWYQVF